jgi:hypothetical protein
MRNELIAKERGLGTSDVSFAATTWFGIRVHQIIYEEFKSIIEYHPSVLDYI